jgi:hypothetical protein
VAAEVLTDPYENATSIVMIMAGDQKGAGSFVSRASSSRSW